MATALFVYILKENILKRNKKLNIKKLQIIDDTNYELVNSTKFD